MTGSSFRCVVVVVVVVVVAPEAARRLIYPGGVNYIARGVICIGPGPGPRGGVILVVVSSS